jgi:hypothetical protein
MKPAHIVFVQKPIDVTKITVYGDTKYKVNQWNYKLGAWALSEYTSFASERTKGVLAFMDIKNQYLQSTATASVDIASYVMVNDSMRIDAITKTTDDNIVNVAFTVDGLSVRSIDKIELYDASDRLLAVQNAYVPVTAGNKVNMTCRFVYDRFWKVGV